jgi:glutamyl-tRNA synthetase
MSKVVTRFAPSPTGRPHVGNIRTAIFAYLWAKHNKGDFLLRIEDTDRERLVPESQAYIEESLKWLGIEYDQEIIYQSDRKNIHQEYAKKLVSEDKAYKCFCSKERLDQLRNEQIKKKLPPGYDGHCRNLSKEEIDAKTDEPFVIRFKMPKSGEAKWLDGIRGEMSIDYKISDDPIIIKSDGWPTYHLAAVIDDHEMNVTDVIRGEEWISSTPKHLALYDAFSWKAPKFSHMPHINGPDGTKLSKRHGDTAILDYMEKGYLPETLFNFLTLLGWNDGTEKELFTKDELIKSFEISRIGKSPAVFDLKKLDWMNGLYIRSLSNQELISQIKKLDLKSEIINLQNFEKIIEVEKSRLTTLCDITIDSEYYVKFPNYQKELLIFKKSDKETTLKGLKTTKDYLENIKLPEGIEELNKALSKIVEKEKLNNGDVFWPVRVALSGSEKSASPAELLWIFGKDESIFRLKKAIEKLTA